MRDPAPGHATTLVRPDPERAARYRADGFWGDRTLADFVADHAHSRPDADAYVTADDRLSWRGYDQSSDRLAGALIDTGLVPGERVAVFLPDGPSVHTAYLANEKAGITNVGIGARAGAKEMEHLLRRTQASAIVTHAEDRGRPTTELVAELRAQGLPLRHHIVVPAFERDPDAPITIDGAAATTPSDLAAQIAVRRIGPDDLFMINSTSGTTGLPKCVMHAQNRWFYFHQRAVDNAALGADEIVLSAVPAPFGFGQWTAHFTPTYLGAPTVLLERFSAEAVLELIERERVTMLCAVSTQFIMMLKSADVERRDLTSLRVMFTGGEPVPFEQARAFEAVTGATVLQFYGSNESGVATGTTRRDPPEVRLRTAGRAVYGTELRLFDENGEPATTNRGQPGTRGPAICLGYLDDPAANAQLFTRDGFVLHADICEIDDEGCLTVVGRTSDIIIRGGKNISAPQVEEEVAAHHAVRLAAAVAAPDPTFGERVAVFVELKPETTLSLDELVEFLRARGVSNEYLPEHLVVLAELPRSSGGKVAKGALRADIEQRLQEQS
jgi:acyl-CoA synthetase